MRPYFMITLIGVQIALSSASYAEVRAVTYQEESTAHFCATFTKLWDNSNGNYLAYSRDTDGAYGSQTISDSDYGQLAIGSKVTIGPVQTGFVARTLFSSHDVVVPGAVLGCQVSGEKAH